MPTSRPGHLRPEAADDLCRGVPPPPATDTPATAHADTASVIAARLDATAPAWRSLDPSTFERIAAAVDEIEALDPTLVPSGTATIATLEQRSVELRRGAQLLDTVAGQVTDLLDGFGASPNGACGPGDAHRALRLASLSNRRGLSDPGWLHPLGRLRARAAVHALRPLAHRQHELLERLTPLFTDRIFFIDLDPSVLGPNARMSARQRAAVIECTRSGTLGHLEHDQLTLVPLARGIRHQLRAAERHHAGALGTHYVGSDTMFDLIESSLDLIDEAAKLIDADGDLEDLAELVDRLVHPAGSRHPVIDRATEISNSLIEWRDLSERVSVDPSSLTRRGLHDAARICGRTARSIDRLRAAVVTVDNVIDGPARLGDLADIAADVADLCDQRVRS